MTALGRTENASYKEQLVPAYRGNPLIEALPDILSEEAAIDKLTSHPSYDPAERHLPAHVRYHLIEMTQHFFEPLPRHIELEQQFSRVVRGGILPATLCKTVTGRR